MNCTSSEDEVPQEASFGDYSLGISTDGIRQSAAWKIRDYGDNGALTDAQIDDLAARFSLTRNQLGELSWQLGQALGTLPTVVLISRTKAAKDAVNEIEAALRDVASAEKKLQAATKRLAPLYIDSAVDQDTHDALVDARRQLMESQLSLQSITNTLVRAAALPGLALVTRAQHPQKIPDHRRDKVLSTIMFFWDDVGRKLTYTSDPITSERRGTLIDFVNAVVACVSDPPGSLSGDSIVAAIKFAKKALPIINSVKDQMVKPLRPT